MLQKIYIHHYYSEALFYKIFHNTTDRIFDIKNDIGSVFCKFNGTEIEAVFNPNLNDNTDGVHLLDYWTTHRQSDRDKKYENLKYVGNCGRAPGCHDIGTLNRFNEFLSNRKDWVITFFRTEKCFMKHDLPWDFWIGKLEAEINGLSKNHIVVTDNIFLKKGIDSQYKNCYFALTNTVFEWNSIISIRWYYEFKETFERLNFDYDLCYSVRQHKPQRLHILKLLENQKNSKIFLQRTDSLIYIDDIRPKHRESATLDLSGIYHNRMKGDTDFADLTWIEYEHGINWDMFFRFLSKAKMQVLDESWAWFPMEFYSQYLSEKTYGLLLANIPFISTHSYPMEVLEKILGVEPHPFMNDFYHHKGDARLFSKFVEKFMKNYDENYQLCKEWTNKCHLLLMNKLETENSLLTMIMDNFKDEKNKIVPYSKII